MDGGDQEKGKDVGKAIGQLSNFFGSSSSSTRIEGEGVMGEVGDSVMVVRGGEVNTMEEIAVTDNVPSYAPEKCEASASEYQPVGDGKGSSVSGKGSTDTDPVKELELENMLVTEHDIFGSPVEEVGGDKSDHEDNNDHMDTPTSELATPTPAAEEDKTIITIPPDLEAMEAEFKRITSSSSQSVGRSEERSHVGERKRKAAVSDYFNYIRHCNVFGRVQLDNMP